MVEGEGPAPSLVLTLIEGLPDDSLTTALMSGGRQYLGWGENRHLLAGIFDAINLNTTGTGQWAKGKAPEFDPWRRPSDKNRDNQGRKKKTTVADLYNRFPKGG